MKTLRELKRELQRLTDSMYLTSHPKVREAIDAVRKENEPKVKELQQQIKELQDERPKPKPRFPENTPKDVIDVCNKYWSGTEEFHTYRIHCWNDKAVWTSYPSGGFWTNGGYNKAQACFFLISKTDMSGYGSKPKEIYQLEGRVSLKQMQDALNEKT